MSVQNTPNICKDQYSPSYPSPNLPPLCTRPEVTQPHIRSTLNHLPRHYHTYDSMDVPLALTVYPKHFEVEQIQNNNLNKMCEQCDSYFCFYTKKKGNAYECHICQFVNYLKDEKEDYQSDNSNLPINYTFLNQSKKEAKSKNLLVFIFDTSSNSFYNNSLHIFYHFLSQIEFQNVLILINSNKKIRIPVFRKNRIEEIVVVEEGVRLNESSFFFPESEENKKEIENDSRINLKNDIKDQTISNLHNLNIQNKNDILQKLLTHLKSTFQPTKHSTLTLTLNTIQSLPHTKRLYLFTQNINTYHEIQNIQFNVITEENNKISNESIKMVVESNGGFYTFDKDLLCLDDNQYSEQTVDQNNNQSTDQYNTEQKNNNTFLISSLIHNFSTPSLTNLTFSTKSSDNIRKNTILLNNNTNFYSTTIPIFFTNQTITFTFFIENDLKDKFNYIQIIFKYTFEEKDYVMVFNKEFKVSESLIGIYNNISYDTLTSVLLKEANESNKNKDLIENKNIFNNKDFISSLEKKIITLFSFYRNKDSKSLNEQELILPDSIKNIPLLLNCILKLNLSYYERMCLNMMSDREIMRVIYPKMYKYESVIGGIEGILENINNKNINQENTDQRMNTSDLVEYLSENELFLCYNYENIKGIRLSASNLKKNIFIIDNSKELMIYLDEVIEENEIVLFLSEELMRLKVLKLIVEGYYEKKIKMRIVGKNVVLGLMREDSLGVVKGYEEYLKYLHFKIK